MDSKIEQFLLKLPDNKRESVLKVRDIFLSNAHVTEAVKWNQLTFCCGATNIAFIYTYPQVAYINLGFMQATSLADPTHLFEGSGKGMRHIKIRTAQDIPAAQIKKWVNEAVMMAQMA